VVNINPGAIVDTEAMHGVVLDINVVNRAGSKDLV